MTALKFPKCPTGKTRAEEKRDDRARGLQEQRNCYALVDERDGGRCRVCGRRGSPRMATLLDRLHRHHLVYRSLGGQHVSWAVVSICAHCHDEIHVMGTLHLEGDADLRDDRGRLCGVQVSRLRESGWVVEGMC